MYTPIHGCVSALYTRHVSELRVFLPKYILKTLDTIGNCRRQVFSLDVSHQKQTCEILSSLGRRNWEIIVKEKHPCHTHEVVCFQMCDFETSKPKSEVSKSTFVDNYFLLENYVTSEETIFHNVFYYHPLPITRYQVRFYANIYFE